MKKRKRYKPFIISAVILIVTGYLIYTGLRDTMTFYLTVSEVLAQPSDQLTEPLKVGGTVTPGSVQWDPKTLKLSFKVADETANLTINYTGVVPDSFKPGREVIVEGTYQGNGDFLAVAIMPKCASKYE